MAEWAHHTVPRERVFAPALEDGQAAVLDAVREAVLDVLMHERHAFYTDYLAAHTHGTAPPQGDEADEAEEPPLSAAAAAAERAELMQRALAVYARICDDNFLHRYARARAYDVERTCTKVLNSIAWHLAVRPETIRAAEFEEEARTGKIYIGGTDVHGRAVIVLDNTKASALDHDGQMRHLIWSMQRAVRRMQPGGREKFVVFIHLEDFGFTTAPSLRTTQETIKILGGHFPERLGHCVLYKAPYLFWTLWNMVKPIIDVVTREKVVMISGDTSEGTSNDHMLVGTVGTVVGPGPRPLAVPPADG